MLIVNDVNGGKHLVEEEEITKVFMEGEIPLFGMSIADIKEMRLFCMKMGVSLPLNKANLDKAYNYYMYIGNEK